MKHRIFSFCWCVESISENQFHNATYRLTQCCRISRIHESVGSVKGVSKILSVRKSKFFLVPVDQGLCRSIMALDRIFVSGLSDTSCEVVPSPVVRCVSCDQNKTTAVHLTERLRFIRMFQ